MKKSIVSILLCLTMTATAISPAFADDVDSQIEEIETQIEELQEQLKELKEEKARNEEDVQEKKNSENGDLYQETNRIFDVFEVYDEKMYDGIVEITNTSDKPLYLSNGVFDVEDLSGHLIQSQDMIAESPTVVLPGEKGYFYNIYSEELDENADTDMIQFVPHYKVEEAKEIPHEYPLSDVSLAEDDYDGYKVVGRVENDTDEEAGVYIKVMFYDANDEIIGITGTSVYEMEPGSTNSFEISSMMIQNRFDKDSVYDYKLVAQEPYYQR